VSEIVVKDLLHKCNIKWFCYKNTV